MAGNVTLDNGTTQLLNTAMTLLPLVVVMAVVWVVVESIFNGRRQSRTFVTLVAAAGLLAYVLDIAPLWVVLVFVVAAAAVWTVPPLLTKSSNLSTNLNTISAILEERECSKCDAMQIKLTTAEQRLERAMEDSTLAAGQIVELATLKDGLRILRLRDGSEQIIFTTDDEEEWYELYDELQEANKISNEVDVSQPSEPEKEAS